MSIQAGALAPGFSLFDTDKNKVSLAEQKGKNVVLLFFPLAFTGVCTAELCNVRDNISLYNNTNAVVFGISVDSLFSLKKFREEQKLNFRLLIIQVDDYFGVCNSYFCHPLTQEIADEQTVGFIDRFIEFEIDNSGGRVGIKAAYFRLQFRELSEGSHIKNSGIEFGSSGHFGLCHHHYR